MGLYDYMLEFNLDYNELLTRLYNLSQFIPMIDYSKIQKELDGIYNETEYDLFRVERRKQYFQSACEKLWDEIDKDDTKQEMFDGFCDKIDKRFENIHNDFHINAYVRILWNDSNYDQEEISEEILDLGKRLGIRQYCTFRDDDSNIIIVALHDIPDTNETKRTDDER